MQIVLGAGLSGLSLAVALVREGIRETIVVIDRRTEFGHDRTWCTWHDADTPWLEIATHRFERWEVRTATGAARAHCPSRPYVHLRSEDVYAAALAVLDDAPNVRLRLGERVLEIGDGWVRTDAGEYRGLVHDGLALSSPALRERPRGDVELWQTFLGWELETDVPRFTPGVATLMDFGVAQDGDGVSFAYVLAFDERRALVEHTSFARHGPAPEARRAAIERYVGVPFGVAHEERGRLPMTTASLPALRSPRTTAIGIAGGAMRASSGYAFSRVQAHSRALARAIATGAPLPRRAGDPRRAALDAVFLRALADDPASFPEHFRRLVARVDPATFARFMTDVSSPGDEAAVMAALPATAFAPAALRTLLGKKGSISRRFLPTSGQSRSKTPRPSSEKLRSAPA